MKVVPLGKAKNELSTFVDEAQSQRVLITRHGRPAAIMIGVEGEAIEDVLTASDARFWEMIEDRRKHSKTVSADEMRKRLGLGREASTRAKAAPTRSR